MVPGLQRDGGLAPADLCEPLEGLAVALLRAHAIFEHGRESTLRLHEALVGGFPVPGKGPRVILRHGAPLAVENSEVVLHAPASAGTRGTPERWSATRWRDARNSVSA